MPSTWRLRFKPFRDLLSILLFREKVMYLTKQEVAAMLRVSVRTITTYMQQDAIPKPKKLGGILLWNEEELQRKIAYSSALAPVQESIKRGRPRKVQFA